MEDKTELNDFERRIIEQVEHANANDIDFSDCTPLNVARTVFGFNGFKENGQEKIIEFVLHKKGDVLGIIPTGGGKSACFQIPALIQKNMTVVISPLIALMKDQVESLVRKGIHSSFFINSSINEEVKEKIISLIMQNKVKLLYIAPESLQSERIQNILSKVKIDLVVVDEAHCISTWGHNFRPDYLKLAEIIETLGSPPVLALTATATEEVEEDIQKQLKTQCKVFKASFDRPNLYIDMILLEKNVKKELFLVSLLNQLKGSTIVFVTYRTTSEKISEILISNEIKSVHYHAGLDREVREKIQNQFISGESRVIVATIAFGMGIDKP